MKQNTNEEEEEAEHWKMRGKIWKNNWGEKKIGKLKYYPLLLMRGRTQRRKTCDEREGNVSDENISEHKRYDLQKVAELKIYFITVSQFDQRLFSLE